MADDLPTAVNGIEGVIRGLLVAGVVIAGRFVRDARASDVHDAKDGT
jgi:hypothetical protein